MPGFKPLQLKPRERLLAVGSGIVLSLVALDRLVLNPWARHAQTVRQDIQRLEASVQTHARLIERRDHVFNELARHQRYLQPAVADDLQMAALLKELEEIATRSGVLVAEIKPLTTEQAEFSKRYALEVRFQATLEQWVAFVFNIEMSPSLYGVVRAGLSVQPEHPDQLEGSLRLESAALVADLAVDPRLSGEPDG